MATIDIKLKSYDELIFEITKLNTDKYLLEQENKQLKEKLKEAKKILLCCFDTQATIFKALEILGDKE